MFTVTPEQRAAWTEVQRWAVAVAAPAEGPGAVVDEDTDVLVARFDHTLLIFLIRLLQHRLPEREFDSAIVSFAAVLAWDATARS